jgi:hypothetical protein
MADDSSESKTVPLVLTILLILVVLIGGFSYKNWLGNLSSQKTKTKDNALFVNEPKDAGDDILEVFPTIVNVDPLKSEMAVRLEFTAEGGLTKEDGTLKAPVIINVNAYAGKSEFQFKAGETIGPVDFVAKLEGSAFNYPNDQYTSGIEIIASSPVFDPGTKVTKDTVPSSYEAIEISVEGYARAGGFTISKEKPEVAFGKGTVEAETGQYHSSFNIVRSDLVIMFARLIVCLQWLLALSASIVTVSVVIWKRKPELALFTWMTAMLFALPPMRNIMVGAPPIGIYVDFLGFLCCEGIVACSLASVVATWLIRK